MIYTESAGKCHYHRLPNNGAHSKLEFINSNYYTDYLFIKNAVHRTNTTSLISFWSSFYTLIRLFVINIIINIVVTISCCFLNFNNAAGVSRRRQLQNFTTKIFKNVNLLEFDYDIWNQDDKCIQIRRNKPSVSLLI